MQVTISEAIGFTVLGNEGLVLRVGAVGLAGLARSSVCGNPNQAVRAIWAMVPNVLQVLALPVLYVSSLDGVPGCT